MRRRLIPVLTALTLLTQAGCGFITDLIGQAEQTPEVLPTATVAPTAAPAPTATPAPSVKTTPAPGQFVFTRDNFPRLDGSTTMAPLGEAIASVLLSERREDVSDLIAFNKTSQSVRNLGWGYCDIALVAEPPEDVLRELDAGGFEYEMSHISTDALIFTVNAENPVDSLTVEQIRGIYSGEITNWFDVGGYNVPIAAFQRNEESGSQAAMKRLIMKDTPAAEPPLDFVIGSMEGLMEAMRNFDGSEGAIGYTMYYYANDMKMAEGLKVIAVNGAAPDTDSIRSGLYPLPVKSFALIAKSAEEESPQRIMRDWLLADDGQRLIESQGYVPVSETRGA